MKSLLQDVRFGLRMLRKSPGFTAVAIITLALGIGANTAIFSLINAIMLRTLPVKDPQRLVQLNWVSRETPVFHNSYNWGGCLEEQRTPGDTGCSFSYPIFEQVHAQRSVFSGVFAFFPMPLAVNFNGRTSQASGLFASGDFFSTLGAHAALGRLLGPSDDSEGAAPVIVVSYRFWQTVLAGDPVVIGKPIFAGKIPATVVGVASLGFLDLDPGVRTDFWLPLSLQPTVEPRLPKRTTKFPWLELMARLRTGVTTGQAEAAMSTIFAHCHH
jgi:MacB-like periplasmic core domain